MWVLVVYFMLHGKLAMHTHVIKAYTTLTECEEQLEVYEAYILSPNIVWAMSVCEYNNKKRI